MEIAPGIYQLKVPIPDNPLGYLNCYMVEGKDGWVMIDTGWNTPDAFKSLTDQLRDIGLALTDIATIIVTHVHPDHFGLAGRIKQLSPKTELLTHRFEADLIDPRYFKFSHLRDTMVAMLRRNGVPPSELEALESASMPTLQFVTVTMPDHFLYGGEIITTGLHELEVIWTPGHSVGHICLYEYQNRLLFSGDHILPSISPNISYHVQSGDNPLGDYIYALHKLENLPVSKVLPAHEHIFTNLKGRIEEITEHHEKRKIEIQQAISQGARNAYEISAKVTWNTLDVGGWEKLPALHKRAAMMETVAHLECMRWEGKVKRLVQNNCMLYELA